MKKQKKICFSDSSYGNRKSHGIWGCLEAILRVLGLIYGRRGVEHPPALIGLSVALRIDSMANMVSNILYFFAGGGIDSTFTVTRSNQHRFKF